MTLARPNFAELSPGGEIEFEKVQISEAALDPVLERAKTGYAKQMERLDAVFNRARNIRSIAGK